MLLMFVYLLKAAAPHASMVIPTGVCETHVRSWRLTKIPERKQQNNHLVWLFSFAFTSPVKDDSPQTGFWKGFGKIFEESETFLAHFCSLRTFKYTTTTTTVVNDVVMITFSEHEIVARNLFTGCYVSNTPLIQHVGDTLQRRIIEN